MSLQERLKYGGYRCITLRVHDTKGGDFVENPDLTMVVCSLTKLNKAIPLSEVSKEIPLLTSPEGLYKQIDIGVNNYNPHQFTEQDFQVYFLKDSRDYANINESQDASVGGFQVMNDMRSEAEIFQERIEHDLVAFGNFNANDIINHSMYQEEFNCLEPGLFEQQQSNKSNPKNLKEARKNVQRTSAKKQRRGSNLSSGIENAAVDDEEEASDFSGYKLPLFNAGRTQ